MTEYPAGVALTLDGLSQGQLADLVGGIGRKLDSAFAAGEVSEQEYADLNRGLDAYAEFMTEKAERERASFAVMKQTAAATKAQLRSGASEEDMADCAEQVRETWQEKLRAYLAENSYDRTALRQMIAAIRAGERLSVRLPPDAPPEKAARETASLRGAGTGAEISRMFYRDGSASLALRKSRRMPRRKRRTSLWENRCRCRFTILRRQNAIKRGIGCPRNETPSLSR